MNSTDRGRCRASYSFLNEMCEYLHESRLLEPLRPGETPPSLLLLLLLLHFLEDVVK